MVKLNAKPEKDGSPSQNPSNVSETKFPVINKIPINSIAKKTQLPGFIFEFYYEYQGFVDHNQSVLDLNCLD